MHFIFLLVPYCMSSLLQALLPALAARQAVPGIRGSLGRSRRYFGGRRGEALEDRSPLYRSFDAVASIQFMPAITYT